MSKRILIVEDSRTCAATLAKLVESIGFEPDIAETGEKALKRVECYDYALVLMDLRLPGRDGFDIAATMRALGKKVPIISVTAYPLGSDVQRCVDAGIDDSICKGYRRDELQRIIGLWAHSGDRPKQLRVS
ncbi:MAG TPA: response regulator [Candidatus Obscuribacterales bacterium]